MADADVLAEIDKTTKQLADAALTAAGNVMTEHVTGYRHGAMRDALVAFCESAAEVQREIAELWVRSKKRGAQSYVLRCKGAATGFEDVATLLRQLRIGEGAEQATREPITAPLRDPFNYDEVSKRYQGGADESADPRSLLAAEPEPLTTEQADAIADAGQASAEETRAYIAGEIDTLPVPHGYVLRKGVAVPAETAGDDPTIGVPFSPVTVSTELLADAGPQAVDVVMNAHREAAGSLQEFVTGDLVNGCVNPHPDDFRCAMCPPTPGDLLAKMSQGVNPDLPPHVEVFGGTYDSASWAQNREGISTVETAQFPFSEPVGPAAPAVKPLTFAELAALPRDAMPEHLSWSQITSLEDCAAAYGIERLGGHAGKPNWSTVGGKAVHRVIDTIETSIAGGVEPSVFGDPMTLQTLWDMYFAVEIQETVRASGVPSEAWRVPNRGLEGYDWWRVQGMDMVGRYMDARRHDQRSPVVDAAEILYVPHTVDGATSLERCIEYEMTMDVDGVPVKLVIDQAWRLADGTIVIVDVKTGRTPGDSGQLGLYAHALLQVLHHEYIDERSPAPRILGTFYDARKGAYSEPVDLLERHPWEEYLYRVGAAEERRNARYFAPRRSSFCNGCGVQALCPVGRR